jgi:hypothetical protein
MSEKVLISAGTKITVTERVGLEVTFNSDTGRGNGYPD